MNNKIMKTIDIDSRHALGINYIIPPFIFFVYYILYFILLIYKPFYKNSIKSEKINLITEKIFYILKIVFLPLFFLLGETIIETAKNNAETITIEAPIGKSEISDK